ncbi:MAG: hypothetical protein ACNA8L_07370 [Luteolibacter sp.]
MKCRYLFLSALLIFCFVNFSSGAIVLHLENHIDLHSVFGRSSPKVDIEASLLDIQLLTSVAMPVSAATIPEADADAAAVIAQCDESFSDTITSHPRHSDFYRDDHLALPHRTTVELNCQRILDDFATMGLDDGCEYQRILMRNVPFIGIECNEEDYAHADDGLAIDDAWHVQGNNNTRQLPLLWLAGIAVVALALLWRSR